MERPVRYGGSRPQLGPLAVPISAAPKLSMRLLWFPDYLLHVRNGPYRP